MTLVASAQYVPYRVRSRMNLEAFRDALSNLDEQHRQALNLRNEIINNLAMVQLNYQDENWKNQYINSVKKKIDDAAEYGSYSSALPIARELATEAFTYPELVARYNANQQYEEWKQYTRSQISLAECQKGIDACKRYIRAVCDSTNMTIAQVERYGLRNENMGQAFYDYSVFILSSPNSYKNWLYLLYLSSKCGNGDAKEIVDNLKISIYKDMYNGHSDHLFDLPNQNVVADLFYRNKYERDRASDNRDNIRYHKVHKGETLSSIAHKYGTTVAALCKLNGISKNVHLRVGQILRYS